MADRVATVRAGRDGPARPVQHSTKRAAAGIGAGLAAAALVASALWPPRPRLVWNASASSPPGLYRVRASGRVATGEVVVAWAPAPARWLAARRHYLPANVPLVKRVGASAGDCVCAIGDALLINGRLAARRRWRDARGRAMPAWTGCRRLAPGELLLLGDHPDSFDGRYFGVTRPGELVGRARLIWPA